MARTKGGRGRKPARSAGGRAATRATRRQASGRTGRRRRAAKRPKKTARKRAAGSKKTAARPRVRRQRAAAPKGNPAVKKIPRLDRVRRTLDESEMVPTPPSSLDMDRHGSAARSGRAEHERRTKDAGLPADIAGGDLDVDLGDAYFTGDEVPGGDNPSPDMDVVEDIGKALGVHYDDNEELKSSDKVGERDKHRWELDPASSEDYKDRK